MPSEAQFTRPHPECPEPELWSAPDSESSETEVADFLQALVRLLKPRIVVETGTFKGHTTLCLARRLRANGRGRVDGLELDGSLARQAAARVAHEGLDDWATVCQTSSLSWQAPGTVDLAFLDAGGDWHRVKELLYLRRFMDESSVVCVHDTARENRLPRAGFEGLAAQGLIKPVWIHTFRGLMVGQPRWPSAARPALGTPRYAASRTLTGLRAAAARLIRA